MNTVFYNSLAQFQEFFGNIFSTDEGIGKLLVDIDKQLMIWLNFDGGQGVDEFWWFVSGKFSWIPLYVLLLWLLIDHGRPFKLRWRKMVILIVITALGVLIADQISSGLIKPLVMRPRPSQLDSGISDWIHLVHDYHGGHYGFVSSHAANTSFVALWFLLLLRGWRRTAYDRTKEGKESRHTYLLAPNEGGPKWGFIRSRKQNWGMGDIFENLLLIYVIFNCYSRIYLGVHYPGDILGGIVVGILTALFCYYVVYPYAKKYLVNA